MVFKRSFSEVETTASARDGWRSDRSGPARKKQKPPTKHTVKDDSINWIKKRAREIERRLQIHSDKIPADKQKELERELVSHRRRIEGTQDKKLRSNMIKKYHMLRFFEKKKALRLQKQLRKRLETATDPKEIDEIQADLHICEVDYNYSIYFPFLEPYISLYPATSKEDDKEAPSDQSSAARALHSPRPPLWATVEKAMEKGQGALEKLRDRRAGGNPQTSSASKTSTKQSSTAKPSVRQDKRGQERGGSTSQRAAGAVGNGSRDSSWKDAGRKDDEDNEDDSDGSGFFEE